MKSFLLSVAAIALFSNNSVAQAKGCFYFNNSDTSISVKYKLLTTSSNESIDRATALEIQFMRNAFGLNADFFFYNDPDTTATGAFYIPEILDKELPDGTICVSTNLVKTLYNKSFRGSTIPIIVAHLVGHAIDFKYNATRPDSIESELFSEFVAGTYLYIRQSYKSAEIESALNTFKDISHTDFGNIETHGLPEQRYYALMAGFNTAKKYYLGHRYFTLQTCVQEGINYVNGYENAMMSKYVGN